MKDLLVPNQLSRALPVDSTATLPCTSKLVFDTEKQARTSAITLKWQKGTKLKAYKCRYCSLWHLASS